MLLALHRWFAGKPRPSAVRRTPRAAWRLTCLEERTVPAATDPSVVVGAGRGFEPRVQIFNEGGTAMLPGDGFLAYSRNFLGGVSATLADSNLDGTYDQIVTCPVGGGAEVRVWDIAQLVATGGQNGILQDFFAFDPSFQGGGYVASGDIDGDGVADIVVGAGASVIDFNNDGVPDAVFTSNIGPFVKAFDGNNVATTLMNYQAYNGGYFGGVRVALGDLGGDNGLVPGTDNTFRNGGFAGSHFAGTSEIVTAPGIGGGADIKIWSFVGALQADQLGEIFPEQSYGTNYRVGTTVAVGFFTGNIDDQNFAYADISLGADAGGGPRIISFRFDGALAPDQQHGYHYVFANEVVPSAPGEPPDPAPVDPNYPLTSFFAYSSTFPGGVRIAATRDVNGNGRDELVTGPGPSQGTGQAPTIKVLDGLNGSQIHSYSGFTAANYDFGVYVG